MVKVSQRRLFAEQESARPVDWRRKMSDNIAYALLVYTALQIFVTMGALKSEGTWIRVYPHWGAAREVEVWQAGGGHGGADPIMLGYIFAPEAQAADPYLRAADQRAGAWSISVGIAANASMASGQAVTIADLVGAIDRPDYPGMPSGDGPLPLPVADGTAARV